MIRVFTLLRNAPPTVLIMHVTINSPSKDCMGTIQTCKLNLAAIKLQSCEINLRSAIKPKLFVIKYYVHTLLLPMTLQIARHTDVHCMLSGQTVIKLGEQKVIY